MSRKIPDVQFTIHTGDKTEEEIKMDVQKLIQKRNELLKQMGLPPITKDKSFMEEDMENKYQAGMLGFAIGDALGVPVEFQSRNTLEAHPVQDMRSFGTHLVPEGTWSDDTSLVLATMDSILAEPSISFEDMMQRFDDWYRKGKYTATDEVFDIGITTCLALQNFEKHLPATACGGRKIKDNGNGSLMRMLPIAYYLKKHDFSLQEEVDLVNQFSSLTHGHEISCLACKIYCDYVKFLFDGQSPLEAYQNLKKIPYEKYYSMETVRNFNRILNLDLLSLSKDEIQSNGYVVSSLEASLWSTLQSQSYEEAVLKSVNLGSDTDTIGAITGSINGIIYGMENIPDKWISKLKKADYIKKITNQFLNSFKKEEKRKL